MKLFKKRKQSKAKCPICDCSIDYCQCIFGGSAHPNRSKRREVVLDHLYLFNKKQIKHIMKIQEYWQTCYGDEERTAILDELESEYR